MFVMGRWRRIGVAVSVLCCLGFVGYWWAHRLDIADAIRLSQLHLCDGAYDPDEAARKICRTAVQTQFLQNAQEADRDWPWILTFCVATLSVAWCTAWTITAMLRWMVRSFRRP